jgi:D-arabinitol 4-dehydrogenase
VPAGERWTLTVGNIRDDMRKTMDALAAQHGAYTLETVTPQGERAYETIRAISRVLPWSPDLAALVDAGADPACRIVSFTVTEGGYYLDEHNRLDLANADLAADLQGARTTLYGALAALLAERVARGAGPLTLQSCDNLRNNGARFRAGMRAFLEQRGETALLAWFDAHVATPSAMVDRITPRPTPTCANACARRPASTTPARDGRILHPVGDRGPLRGRPPALGAGRRGAGGRRCTRTKKRRSAS